MAAGKWLFMETRGAVFDGAPGESEHGRQPADVWRGDRLGSLAVLGPDARLRGVASSSIAAVTVDGFYSLSMPNSSYDYCTACGRPGTRPDLFVTTF